MNIFTVIFWQLAQMAILVALGAIELRNPWMMTLAPPAVWEPFLVVLVLGYLAWVLAAAIWGSADAEPPQVDVRRMRRSLAQRLFPPPPAARRAAYASRTTKRQRRVIP